MGILAALNNQGLGTRLQEVTRAARAIFGSRLTTISVDLARDVWVITAENVRVEVAHTEVQSLCADIAIARGLHVALVAALLPRPQLHDH